MSDYQGYTRILEDGTETEPTFYLVNPAGAIHIVTKGHAEERLQDARFRLAEDDEIERFLEARVQRAGRPVAQPWNPLPDVLKNLPVSKPPMELSVKITDGARKLAIKEGLDKATIEGIPGKGAKGQIRIIDVREFLDKVENPPAKKEAPKEPPSEDKIEEPPIPEDDSEGEPEE